MNNVLNLIPERDVASELFDLQKEQLEHDSKYHRDICILNVHQRMNHYALHFAKYSGYFVEALRLSDNEKFCQAIVDSFIITLATANTLNVDLGANADKMTDGGELIGYDRYKTDENDRLPFVLSFVETTGRLAKACESVDHLEPYPFRQEMTSCAKSILYLVMKQSSTLDLDLPKETRKRLATVKERNIFHNR